METFVHEIRGFGIHPSRCKVYVQLVGGITYFCFEDIGIGTSVTNASEQLATEMVEKYGVSPIYARFFETYSYPREKRTLDEIEYVWIGNKAGNPRWKPSNATEIFSF